ncbi:sensor histidine kinase [Winogradskyella ursingii]|uniref:sensor histidine kinase n=1 Tax=Winogradskyella ursingii TaxID=2686079 RepID=UPI0015C7F625|nr:PAS domain-containing sensor histidine kinase [Winogradskyella ursingii]
MSSLTKQILSHSCDISLLDFIQKAASIGTWEFDIESNSLYWSDETKRIHEVPLDYIPNVETGISFYKQGYSRNRITELFTICLEKLEKYDAELQIVTANGKDKWVRAIGIPVIENGKCIKVQGLFQDIDEKTKNARELAYKEDQLRRTFDNALVGMAIVDLNGSWLNVNKSLCKTFGYTKEELKQLSFMDITHPDDLRVGYKAMMNMVNGKINYFETEKRYLHKNGNVIWALLSTSIVKDKNGTPLHFVAQINDLTQIKKSSSKVAQLLATTENQNKRLLNFAHIVSHNLRSHYSNLDMLLDIMKMDVPETTKNSIFPLIEDAVNHLGDTVSNLNDVAVMNTKRNINVENVNLSKSIDNVLSSIAAQILQTQSKVSVDVDPKINISGIPAYIDSILLNFLTNSIKYKRQHENAVILLRAYEKGEYIVLEIIDNGQGIDLSKHGDKLFGMYKTFHNHEDSRGLGLFITKNQIEAIGGKIEVNSEVNKGTTFYIHLRKHETN